MLKKILKISAYVLILCFVVIILIFIVDKSSDDKKSLFGYRSFIVTSDSMKPEFKSGDLIFSKVVDTDTINPGDIISFTSRDPKIFGDTVTHEVVRISEDKTEFFTRGINPEVYGEDDEDEYSVPKELVLGVYRFKIPYVGYFFNFLQTDFGFVILFVVPLSLLIITEFIHFLRLLHKYKHIDEKELIEKKEEELEAYKAKVEELSKKLEEKVLPEEEKE